MCWENDHIMMHRCLNDNIPNKYECLCPCKCPCMVVLVVVWSAVWKSPWLIGLAFRWELLILVWYISCLPSYRILGTLRCTDSKDIRGSDVVMAMAVFHY